MFCFLESRSASTEGRETEDKIGFSFCGRISQCLEHFYENVAGGKRVVDFKGRGAMVLGIDFELLLTALGHFQRRTWLRCMVGLRRGCPERTDVLGIQGIRY
jgi:hypothetical protein